MDPVEEALLLAIREAPGDDHPRLVYADWLAAHEPARAELIAVGVELARDPARADLAARRDELLALPELAWWRGFSVEKALHATAEDFVRDPDILFRKAPIAAALALADPGPWLPEVVRMPALARYRGLRLYRTSRRAARCDGHALLAACATLRGLEELVVADGDLDDAGLRAIAQSEVLAPRRLSIAGNGHLTAAGLLALTTPSERMSRVEHLDVSDLTRVRDGLAPVLRGAWRDTLRSIRAQRCGLDGLRGAGLAALASRPHLEDLDAGHNNLAHTHAAGLAAGRASLVRIGLAHNRLGDAGLAALAAIGFTRLARLDVTACGLTPPAIARFFSELPASLRALDLAHNSVGVALDALAVPQLEQLRLAGGDVDEASAIRFMRSPAASHLRALDVAGCALGESFAAALADAPLSALRELRLDARGLSAPLLERLRARFGETIELTHASAFAV